MTSKEQMLENIRNWNNQPETIKKLEKALKFGEIDSIDFIRMDTGPGLYAIIEVCYTDGFQDFWKIVRVHVNRKGEFK